MALQPTRRARGSNARAVAAFETTPGTPPNGGSAWGIVPFVSHSLGEERGLIASDLLGQGREMEDPVQDVAVNDGDIVVPVDTRNFGRWLKLFLGQPTTTGTTEAGFKHVFASGALVLPSMAIEIGHPEVPAFSVHRGARGNQLRIAMSRTGLLNATCSLICIGETDIVNATVAGANPKDLDPVRFPQATGGATKDGAALASVVGADLTFSNNLEKVETIQTDGRIEDSDPGMAQATGTVTLRFAERAMLDAATAGTPVALTFGWKIGAAELLFTVPRVFLPRPKRPVTGPNGIQVAFNWQSSGKNGPCLTAQLLNDVDSY